MSLIDRLRNDHANMRGLLNVLADLASQLHQDDLDVDYHLMLDILDYFTCFPDAVHHPIEDQLFTRLLENAPELSADVAELKAEHKLVAVEGQEIYKDLQGICAGHMVARQRLIEMTEAFISNQLQHMEREENYILRIAREHIREDEWDAFEALHKSEIDPLFCDTVRDTFERLRVHVMESASPQGR